MMPDLTNGAAFSIGLKTSLIAAVVESLPWRINDNLTVAVTSAVVLSWLI